MSVELGRAERSHFLFFSFIHLFPLFPVCTLLSQNAAPCRGPSLPAPCRALEGAAGAEFVGASCPWSGSQAQADAEIPLPQSQADRPLFSCLLRSIKDFGLSRRVRSKIVAEEKGASPFCGASSP